VIKGLGAKLHPMSGAGYIKGDGSDDERSYEVKDANKSFTLKSNDLKKHWKESTHVGKDACMVITFANGFSLVGTIVPTRSITQ